MTKSGMPKAWVIIRNKMFQMFENDGFKGHYMLAFGNHDDMRVGRNFLIDQLKNL